jgi:hypothetical protein
MAETRTKIDKVRRLRTRGVGLFIVIISNESIVVRGNIFEYEKGMRATERHGRLENSQQCDHAEFVKRLHNTINYVHHRSCLLRTAIWLVGSHHNKK